jgi:hypothetical protein
MNRSTIALATSVFFSLYALTSNAAMSVTSAGAAQGLSLTSFATGFPVLASNSAGPTGITFLDGGGVLVCDQPGNVRLLPSHTNGQNANSVPVIQNYGAGNVEGLVRFGSAIYMTQYGLGNVLQLNSNGTFMRTVAGVHSAAGIVANPSNGHLFVSDYDDNLVADVNPATGAVQTFVSSSGPDGLVLSADGNTLYVAASVAGGIRGYNTLTGVQVYASSAISGTVDGLTLGAGPFGGKVFANTLAGQLIEIDLNTNAQTVIASGGSRGDFLTVDPTNNTLLVTQSDSILRLSGGVFVPEPSSLSILGVMTLILLGGRKAVRQRHA